MLNILRAGLFILLAVADAACAAGSAPVCPPVATQPTAEAMQAAMSKARDHGFLWRVSKDGHASYLYGTIHVAKFEWMFPGPSVMGALQATDTVALELDLLDADVRARLMKGMTSPGSTTLPEPLRQRMRKQAEAACLPYESIAAMSPEMQITLLTVMAGRVDGLDASYAIDAVLAGIGHGAQKHMVSLETPEAQAEMLKMGDAKETLAFVQDSLADLESGSAGALLRRIAAVWADSDYEQLARYGEWCNCMNNPTEREMMKKLLDERNPNLAERIDALHKSGRRVFAAVGSLHMFGAFSLPELMLKRGYRVEKVALGR